MGAANNCPLLPFHINPSLVTAMTVTTNVFTQEPIVITLRDTKIEVKPLAVKNISRAITAAEPLLAAFSGGLNPVTILKNADSVIAICALATNQTEEFVGELDATELVKLAQAVIGANVDFFINTTLPAVNTLMESVGTMAEKVTPKEQKQGGKKA